MGRFCVVRSCRQCSHGKPPVAVHCHRFPQGLSLKSKWEDFVNLCNRTTQFRANASHRLCSVHFEPSLYNNNNLKWSSVPTIPTKFTPERAFKFGLIPALDSDFLEKVNDFSISLENLKMMGSQINGLSFQKSSPTIITATSENSAGGKNHSMSDIIIAKVESLAGNNPGDVFGDTVNIATDPSIRKVEDLTEEVVILEDRRVNDAVSDSRLSLVCVRDDLFKSKNCQQNGFELIPTFVRTLVPRFITSGNMEESADKKGGDPDTNSRFQQESRPDPTPALGSSNAVNTFHRKHYFEDLTEDDFATPEGRRLSLNVIRSTIRSIRTRQKSTRLKLKWSNEKIKGLKTFLYSLIDKQLVPGEVNQMIQSQLSRLES